MFRYVPLLAIVVRQVTRISVHQLTKQAPGKRPQD